MTKNMKKSKKIKNKITESLKFIAKMIVGIILTVAVGLFWAVTKLPKFFVDTTDQFVDLANSTYQRKLLEQQLKEEEK